MSYNLIDRKPIWDLLQTDHEDGEEVQSSSRPINAGIKRSDLPRPREETLGGVLSDGIANMWRWVGVILITTSIGIGIALWALQNVTPVYRSSTELLFDFSRQAVVSGLPADVVAPTEVVLNTEMEVLKSSSFIESVVEALDLISDPEFNPWQPDAKGRRANADPAPSAEIQSAVVAENLSKRVRVKLVRDTYVFQITGESQNPQKAALIADMMARLFIASRDNRGRDTVDDATAWLDDRMRELRQETLSAERELSTKMRTAPRNGEQVLDSLIVQIQSIQQRRDRLTTEIDALARLALTLTSMIDNESVAMARAELQDWLSEETTRDGSAELARMIQRLSADTVAVADIQAVHAEILSILKMKSSERDRLHADLNAAEAQYDSISTEWLELKDQERTVSALQAIYAATLDQQKANATERVILPYLPDVNVISKAEPPTAVSFPNRSMFLGLGGLSGVFVGALLAALLAASFPVVRNERDIERLPSVFLAGTLALHRRLNLPKLLTKAGRPGSRLFRAVQEIQISLYAETRATQQKAFLFVAPSGHRVPLSMAYLTAQMEARTGNRVLVFEFGLDDPGLEPDAPGATIADLLDEKTFDPAVVMARNEDTGIDILRVKGEIEGKEEKLLSLLQKRRTQPAFRDYSLINVVSKPLDESPIGYFLACYVDLAVLIVEKNRTRREDAQVIVDRFLRKGVGQLASVLVTARG
ncbi:hypothetical protein [Aestuariicoccus sp. MJ-SS9]|uniref:GumC family protein n=1 Tax=Aestuariicoccus sp. MJ-SS9 TaxID=3079855 RepID=UPI0029121563|nr:hypothetical protein [Aestuariicoccus sp. MJ-SS9]MDU8913849.1 hypothetical protein [Aestuariicoccus sp. MJ-SS9]